MARYINSRVFGNAHGRDSNQRAQQRQGERHGRTCALSRDRSKVTTTSVKSTDTYAYDAYGILTDQTMGSGGETPNPYLYTGEQFDPDLGFYYLRARYNNPETGRFWTVDDFEGWVRKPISLHKYLYTHSDPVNGIDPGGRFFSLAIGSTISIGTRGGYEGARAPVYSAAIEAARQIIWAVALVGATLESQQREREADYRMRLQLQEGDNHYWSTVMTAKPRTGVTSRQVRVGLSAMHASALTDMMLLPFPDSYEPPLYGAVIQFSKRLTTTVEGGGVTQIGNVLRETFVAGGKRFRIDLENLYGHNLRQ